MFKFRSPQVAIHCWGGLGSQLYAIALRIELEEKYPKRSFYFVAHESGVTLRKSELEYFYPGAVTKIQDFMNTTSGTKDKVPSFEWFKKIIKYFVVKIGLIVDGDSVDAVDTLRTWTTQIRGHYSTRMIQKKTLGLISQKLFDTNQNLGTKNLPKSINVHYRLGDLLNLPSKSPISKSRVIDVLRNLQIKTGLGITLHSDSTVIALKYLTGGTIKKITAEELSPIETLRSLTASPYFVGTNSKISAWAVLLSIDDKARVESHLPKELNHHLYANVGSLNNLFYY